MEDPKWEPLLLSWAVDDEPVQLIDFTQGETISPELLDMLQSADYVKCAFNAAFEMQALREMGIPVFVYQWIDTMIMASYAGLPRSLKDVGKALRLPEDQQKMKEGKDLIRYFCVPCRPTKSNGGRTRNLPRHAPEKWEVFRQYNIQDVETERVIRHRLEAYPMPQVEWDAWRMDQRINYRGIKIDRVMAQNAIRMAEQERSTLTEEAVLLSGLDNPNSVAQLKDWLGLEEGQTLRKKDVAELLKTAEGDQKRLLEIRQEIGKSSVKKYEAMIRSASRRDDRVRGTMQFYKANRTGRWCLTGDHEVLTQDGWVRIDEWDGGRIACWNPQGAVLSFQKCDQVCFDYDGPMYDYEDTRISQISTPDHKMYYKPRYTSDFIVGTVEEMAKHRPGIPLTGRRTASPTLGRNELRVLIMVQADGHYTQDGILRLRFARKRKIERCKQLLRKCEIMFTYAPYADGTATFSIPLRAQPIWLRMFRKKVFDWWMINEDPDVFFEELPLWDGYWAGPNSQQYCTTKKQNADVVQALAHLSGRTAVIVSKDSGKPGWNTRYTVNIWEKPGEAHEIKAKPIISDFSGKVYCAVTPTGFFLVRRNGRVWITGNSGAIMQPQNFPQNHLDDLDFARNLVINGDIEAIKLIFGSVNDTLSQLLRTALIPEEGNKFAVADFSAIEARVIAWLADEQWRIDTFAQGGDIYCASASQMFHCPVVKHGVNGHLRQKGKIAELALGYGGSTGAMVSMGALDMGLKEEELPEIVKMWREASPNVCKLWYAVENAAMSALSHPGKEYPVKHGVAFMKRTDTNVLCCKLPSGRTLHYIRPHIGENRFGGDSITYEGNEAGKWGRVETFGGKMTENIIQALARDCLKECMLTVSETYNIVFHVHDEMIVETDQPETALKDMLEIMSRPVPWAPGLLLKGDGYTCPYYIKD